jgi:hydrogenase-4 component A
MVSYTADGTMPLQCRQCEDAPCAIVCPVRAIAAQNNTIRLNESLCIGCKMCGLACPFGVVLPGGTPIPFFGFNIGQYSYVNSPYQTDPMHLREMNEQGFLSLLAWQVGQPKVAVKCDLCFFDELGPACVRACPHKALSLIEDGTEDGAERVSRMKAPDNVRKTLAGSSMAAARGED